VDVVIVLHGVAAVQMDLFAFGMKPFFQVGLEIESADAFVTSWLIAGRFQS